ncbi:MAG: hypothetical protein IKU71_09075 [Kiritimatiellae bacterium]|nr:hypothetical protein [Kiritimatiellia bacterium]
MAGKSANMSATDRETGISAILRLSLPLVASALITAINGFTDNFFLARHSEPALRAALPANVFAGCVTTLVVSVLGYCGTMFARAHGGRRPAHAVAITANGLLLAAASSAVFAAAIPSARLVLGLFGHADDIAGLEYTLSSIVLAGGPLAAVAAVSAGFFSGQGLTKTVGLATFLGVSVKIALTPALVFGIGPLPELGIAGAGYSFIVSQCVVCSVYVASGSRNPLARQAVHHLRLLKFRPQIAAEILRFGGPLCGRTLVGYGSFFTLVALLGRLDAAPAAASTAIFAINCPFNAVIMGTSEGIEILCGRRMGEGNLSAVARTVKSGCCLAAVLSIAYIVALALFGQTVLGWFLSDEAKFDTSAFYAAGRGVVAMLMLRITFEFMQNVFQAALRGIGNTRAVFYSGVIVSLAAWIPGFVVVTYLMPTAAAYWAIMVATSIVGGATCLTLLVRSMK